MTGSLLLGTALTSAWMVTHSWTGSALSGRPALWHVAVRYIQQSPWIGNGPDAWPRLYTLSAIPYADQRSAHNQWLDVLFAAGLIGAVLFAVTLLVLICTAGSARVAVLVALTAMGVVGVAEPAWLIGGFDVLSYSLVAALLLGPPAPASVVRVVVPGRVQSRRVVSA